MNYLSKCITRWLLEREIIDWEDKELYEYAVYSLILTVGPLVLILIIGGLSGKVIESLTIIFPFMFIRKFSGGIHAKELWVCLLSSCGILFLTVWLVDKLNNETILSISVLAALFCLVVVSPIDSENRRLSIKEKKEYKIITIYMTAAFVVIYGILLYTEFKVYAVGIAEGIILTAVLQIPCIVKRLWKLCRRKKDQKSVKYVVSSKND